MKYLIIITITFIFLILNSEEDFDLSFDDSFLLENNAKLLSEIIFKEDKAFHNDSLFTGIAYEKFENDNFQLLEKYKNGQKDGFSFSWYDNGQVLQEFYYLKGNKHGVCQTWYKNGQKQMRGIFAYGRLNGEFKGWDETGFLLFDLNYTDDTRREESEIEEDLEGDSKDNSKE